MGERSRGIHSHLPRVSRFRHAGSCASSGVYLVSPGKRGQNSVSRSYGLCHTIAFQQEVFTKPFRSPITQTQLLCVYYLRKPGCIFEEVPKA
jgi:hypothetical protein